MKYELDINTKYTRETAPSSYPNPIGGEYNQEQGKCNNFKLRNNEGREENPENKITHIVVGYTVGEYKASLGNFLTGNVGTHFLIKKDGLVDQLVKTEYAPYALGPGALAGKLNPEHVVKDNLLNNFAITIHNVNDAKTPFTDKQIEANAYLMEKLMSIRLILNL